MAPDRSQLKTAGAAGGLVLLILAGVGLHWHALTSRRASIADLQAKSRAAAEANAAAEQAVRDLPALRSAASRFARRVPPDADLRALLGSAGPDGGPAGTPDREIVTRPTVPGQPVARVPFVLQYRGSFDSAVTLLRRLREGPLLTHVERLVIESDATSVIEGEKPLRVEVEFSTFARTTKELEAWSQVE